MRRPEPRHQWLLRRSVHVLRQHSRRCRGSQGIDIAIRCNELLDADERWILRRFLQNTFNQRFGEKHALFTEEQRRELLCFYAESNRRCMEEFLDEASGSMSYFAEVHRSVV